MNIDLTIDKELLKSLDESLNLSKEIDYKFAVVKGDSIDCHIENWTCTLIPSETASLMIEDGVASYEKIEGRDILIYPIDLSCELEGGHISWVNSSPKLVSRSESI